MTILVTGSSGAVGAEVIRHVAGHGIDVRAQTRRPTETALPAGVTAVEGGLTDVAAMRRAMAGVYAPPLGNKGVLAVDVRDLGELAARELLRRCDGGSVDSITLDVVAPEVLTADEIVAVWSRLLGRQIRYGGDDLDAFETATAESAPDWMAHDLRLMMRRFQRDGMSSTVGTDQRLQAILGRPMRSYREFATETAASWNVSAVGAN